MAKRDGAMGASTRGSNTAILSEPPLPKPVRFCIMGSPSVAGEYWNIRQRHLGVAVPKPSNDK